MAERTSDLITVVAQLRAEVGRLQQLAASRWSPQPPPIGGKVYRNVDQTISAATLTAITFTTVEDDPGSFWDGGNKLIVPAGRAGRYLIVGRVRWNLTAGSFTNPITAVRLNNTLAVARDSWIGSVASGGMTQTAVGTVDVVATDYLELVVNISAITTGPVQVEGQAGTTAAPRSPSLEMWRIAT